MPPAKLRTKFVPLHDGMYAVERRLGSTHWTVGRVAKFGPRWGALGVGARAWTRIVATRAAAVEEMDAGLTFKDYLTEH